jgi:lipoprotein-releasing system permease protein
MTRLEMAIAWRYLRSRRGSRLLSLSSMIAIGGVIVGVAALIVIIGVMTGMQNDLRDKILVASPDIQILTYGADLTMDTWEPVLETVRRQPGVVAAAPFVITQGGIMRVGSKYAAPAQFVGIEAPSDSTAEVTDVREHAVEGDFRFESSDGLHRGVVLGKRLASDLLVQIGDRVAVLGFSSVQTNPIVGIPLGGRWASFEVTGVFETGMYEYDASYAYISIEAAQQLGGLGSAVTGIEVRTPDREQAADVGQRLVDSLGAGTYRSESWQEANRPLFSALRLEKLGMAIILLLIVLVAAFNIVSTLTMMVTEKTREIGILRAMGMHARSVRRIFFMQGFVIGGVGTAIGLTLGLIAALALERWRLFRLEPSVYFIDHLPVDTQPVDVLWIVLASLAIAAIATLYPAMQAARLYPLEAIRHE